jgi:hypothetical protein
MVQAVRHARFPFGIRLLARAVIERLFDSQRALVEGESAAARSVSPLDPPLAA